MMDGHRIFLLLFKIINYGVPIYLFYLMWFRIDKMEKMIGRGLDNQPDFWPFKKRNQRIYESGQWVIAGKLFTLAVFLIILVLIASDLYAWLQTINI